MISTPSTDPVVRADGLTKRYGARTVVDGVDLVVPRGRCFGFLGPNGAGKTTTLRMILGLTPASAGTLSVFGLPMPAEARRVRARLGVVPQADNLDPDFSVAENLRIYAGYFGLARAEVEPRIASLLEFSALKERAGAKTDSLSGGMRRRLTIARALVNEPEMLILDEPTTGLDPQARHVIWGRLAELRGRGISLLLTTHYMEEAERLCDELVIMDQGRILDQGSPRELIARHVEPEVIEIRAEEGGVLDPYVNFPGYRAEQMGSSLYCYAHDTAPLLEQLREAPGLSFVHRPSGLEDVFLRLTGRELRD